MKIEANTCYSHILYVQSKGVEFRKAVKTLVIESPNFSGEGINGFIETRVLIEVDQLDIFTKIWTEWYTITPREKDVFYSLAKGDWE